MTEEQIALAKRAVACKGWRWMPGMRVLGGDRITERTLAITHGCLPDLTDPATLGCLLALVREAHKCPEAHVPYATVSRLWVVRWGVVGGGQRSVDALTEAAALVAALEAVP